MRSCPGLTTTQKYRPGECAPGVGVSEVDATRLALGDLGSALDEHGLAGEEVGDPLADHGFHRTRGAPPILRAIGSLVR